MRITKLGWIFIAVTSCALLGTCVKMPETKRPMPVPTLTIDITATTQPESTPIICDRLTWAINTREVLDKLPEAITLDLVDALITKYDAVKIPYNCDYADIADELDTQVRLALGSKRSAFTIKNNPDQYLQEAEAYTFAAVRLLVTYNGKP